VGLVGLVELAGSVEVVVSERVEEVLGLQVMVLVLGWGRGTFFHKYICNLLPSCMPKYFLGDS
jgi:hypothetical protein